MSVTKNGKIILGPCSCGGDATKRHCGGIVCQDCWDRTRRVRYAGTKRSGTKDKTGRAGNGQNKMWSHELEPPIAGGSLAILEAMLAPYEGKAA